MKENSKIAVIGSGSWATALVKVLLNNEDTLTWFIKEDDIREHIRNFSHNPKYLSSVVFDVNKLVLTENIIETIEKNDILLFVVPSAFLTQWLEPYKGNFNGKYLISAIKGIISDGNLTIAEYFNQHFKVPFDNIGVISGPTHSEEVALERLSYLTVAFKDCDHSAFFAKKLECRYIKTILSTDIYGIEYAAVLKNIIALAAGICHGMGYGDNFLSVLISNGYKEIKRFLDKSYSSKRKTSNSVYLGDLLVTCYSQFSRNRTFGTMIGKGYSVQTTQLEMNMIAEGYYSVACIKEINRKYKIHMPITDAVYNILYKNMSPASEIKILIEELK